jgi:HAE1 family hydrophobic/amphiphilic exporter-1
VATGWILEPFSASSEGGVVSSPFAETRCDQPLPSVTSPSGERLTILLTLAQSAVLMFALSLRPSVAILGAYLALSMRAFENDIFATIGLIMLIGLSAKNATLIVEFAVANYEKGLSISESALQAARLRFRPIIMTALAFIFGCLPLWTASGSGAASRRILGTVVIGGMVLASVLGILIVPATFAVVEYLSHRFGAGEKNLTMDSAQIGNGNIEPTPDPQGGRA